MRHESLAVTLEGWDGALDGHGSVTIYGPILRDRGQKNCPLNPGLGVPHTTHMHRHRTHMTATTRHST